MEGSQVAGLDAYIFTESTDDEFVTPSDNNSKNLSSQLIENKESNESGEGLASSSNQIIDKISNTSETALSDKNNTSDEAGVFTDNNSKNESEAVDNQQIDKMRQRKKSIVFSSKKKPSSRETENEELDDSGIALENSNEICSPIKAPSVVVTEKSTSSKTSRSLDRRTSDKGEISDESSVNDGVIAETHQAHKIGKKGSKVSATKRKLSSQKTEDEESEESGEKPIKRGRGAYKLRHISKRNLPGNSSKVDRKDGTEDSEEEKMEMKINEENKQTKRPNEDGSLSERQVAHNKKILSILNKGSIAQLRALNRVGLKTAMMIHEFRELKGKLKSFKDLEKMTGWSAKFREQFFSSNNVSLD